MGRMVISTVRSVWLAESVMGASFRLAWALSSLLFFVVPGWIVFRRERRTRARYGAAIDGEAGAVRADSEDIT